MRIYTNSASNYKNNLTTKSSCLLSMNLIRDNTGERIGIISGSSLKLPNWWTITRPASSKFLSNRTSMAANKLDIDEEGLDFFSIPEEKLLSEVVALYGSWADREDIDDDWLDKIRSGWEHREFDSHATDTEDLHL
jgi:hypothetical protein